MALETNINHVFRRMRPEDNGVFDAAKDPMVVMQLNGNCFTFVNDPDAIRDIFTTKDQFTDKTEMSLEMFREFLGESFLFAHTDDVWKAKRKACAHAFYKERLLKMMDIFKMKLRENASKWLDGVAASGSHRIDIAQEFERIFAHNIIHIAFGEDINDERFEMMWLTDKHKKSFVKKTVSFGHALQNIYYQLFLAFNSRF